MKNPLISVVMSAYNAEKFIAKAIQSILNQTFTDFKFIIINDGSTDKTNEIINNFTDDRIVLIDKPQNSGLIAALNDGIDIAKGEFIARMDADDESLPQRFKLQIEFMQKNPDIDVLGTATFLVNGNKTEIMKRPQSHQNCLKTLVNGVCIWHPTLMIRKKVLGNIKYNENYAHAEDYKLWVDLAMSGAKFANLQTPLFTYNLHGGNISMTKSKQQSATAKEIQKQYLYFYLSPTPKQKIDVLFNEKTVTLKELSELYDEVSTDKKPAILNFFIKYIRDNITSINYQFGKVRFIFWLYYVRYKTKYFLKK